MGASFGKLCFHIVCEFCHIFEIDYTQNILLDPNCESKVVKNILKTNNL